MNKKQYMMIRVIVFLMAGLMLVGTLKANNVRITREIKVESKNINTVDNIATVDMQIAWDNSWKDDFNWDAVYIFLKYKKKTASTWNHVYLRDAYHQVTAPNNTLTYAWWTNKWFNSANYSKGIFVYRQDNGTGPVTMDLKLQWNLAANGLTVNDFVNGVVEYSASCIEMVYVPRGTFYLGDGKSANTFMRTYKPILPEWDVVSKAYKIEAIGTNDAAHRPEKAANRVNEPRSGYLDNAWCAKNAQEAMWIIDFGAGNEKRILYFGVSGVLGYHVYTPTAWFFEGSTDRENWTLLQSKGNGDAWVTGGESYPVANAIEVDRSKFQGNQKFRYYRLRISNPSYPIYTNNIAMTEVDLSTVANNTFVVDGVGNSVPINTSTGLSAKDRPAAEWTGWTLAAEYPTGYDGFYAMKYEISQEQYVRFLNKLTLEQQKKRTIGAALEELLPGDYVYGSGGHRSPIARNGIVVGTKLDEQIIFANNLNSYNDVSQEDDGQTLACNFLSVNDMLAYADWAGLRPLSEMEYEKMGHRPYPEAPKLGEWAWNSNTSITMPASEDFEAGTEGGPKERLSAGNVNGGGKVSGPVRVGSFAKGATNPIEAGSSYWGMTELSGNLSEIYYNVSNISKNFRPTLQFHGDGTIDGTTGDCNVDVNYWPRATNAFIVRGGSFKSAKEQLAVSDRSMDNYFTDMNKKDSTVTFRVGHSYTYLISNTCSSYIELANNTKSNLGDGKAVDNVCSGTPYTIKGSELLGADSRPIDNGIRCSYVWYVNEGTGAWNIIPNQNGKDLTCTWYNDAPVNRPVNVIRMAMTSEYVHQTPYVTLQVVNTNYTINRKKDTVEVANASIGVLVKTDAISTFTWRWKAAGLTEPALAPTTASQYHSFMASRFEYFKDPVSMNEIMNQNQVLVCEINMGGVCKKIEEVEVFVKERLKVGIESSKITVGGTDPSRECGVIMQDARDPDNVYSTVKIGNQCWMAENLRYFLTGSTVYRTGDAGGKMFGALYTWSPTLATNVCPAGWRMPTDTDFNELKQYLEKSDGYTAQKLRTGNFWMFSEPHMGNNSSGFCLNGGGPVRNDGTPIDDSYAALMSDMSTYGAIWRFDYNNANGAGFYYWTSNYYYTNIRCIKRK